MQGTLAALPRQFSSLLITLLFLHRGGTSFVSAARASPGPKRCTHFNSEQAFVSSPSRSSSTFVGPRAIQHLIPPSSSQDWSTHAYPQRGASPSKTSTSKSTMVVRSGKGMGSKARTTVRCNTQSEVIAGQKPASSPRRRLPRSTSAAAATAQNPLSRERSGRGINKRGRRTSTTATAAAVATPDHRLAGDDIGEGEVEARSSDVGISQRASPSSKGGGSRSKQRKAPIKGIGSDDRNRQTGRGSKQEPWDVNSRHVAATARDKKAKPFVIVCDAESVTHPELLDCLEIFKERGTRNIGLIYADWRVTPPWRSHNDKRSKADRFRVVQRDPLPPGSDPLGDNTMAVDVVNIARSELYKSHEFCLLSSDDSMADLARRLREEGRVVHGVGRRRAPEAFLENCDTFMYIDPANRYELLTDEGLVISVALCIALVAAGQETCDWVRMKTIVKSLHAWDMGLEQPNWYGYNDFDEIIEAMDMYIQGVEDVSGEVVLKVPPKPSTEVPRGLEEVATYLYSKWVSYTDDPRKNDILLACIPPCVQAVSLARSEMTEAIKRFRRKGFVEHP